MDWLIHHPNTTGDIGVGECAPSLARALVPDPAGGIPQASMVRRNGNLFVPAYNIEFLNTPHLYEPTDDKSFRTCYTCRLAGHVLIGEFHVIRNDVLEGSRNEIYIKVRERMQRKGFGREIYRNFIQKAVSELGWEPQVMAAVVDIHNEASVEFHKAMGFPSVWLGDNFYVYDVEIK